MPQLLPAALACALALAPTSSPPEQPGESAAAPAEPAPDPAPVAQVIDDERPEPSGHGLLLRQYREVDAAVDVDLERLWKNYQQDIEAGHERRTFAEYVAGSFRARRGLGIALTSVGIAYLCAVPITIYFALGEGEVGALALGLLSVGALGLGVTGVAVGGTIWRRNAERLRDLRHAGLIAGDRRLRLRAAGPVLLPRGAGLGFALSF